LSSRIRDYDRKLEAVAEDLYPETKLLRQVKGVGPLTALAFVLTVEDPSRFRDSRTVGAYLGLVPGKDQSGGRDPQQRISKRGDEMLRKLLVSCAHYVLGPFGEDSDLKRHGLKIAARGGARTPRGGRSWQWRGSSRCCCTVSGPRARPTSRSTTPTATGARPPEGDPPKELSGEQKTDEVTRRGGNPALRSRQRPTLPPGDCV
jgi:hypothetical protein